ncbi:MAG: transglutaminase-like domain-containing protein [Thermodesulforhabdaceae bacterium]
MRKVVLLLWLTWLFVIFYYGVPRNAHCAPSSTNFTPLSSLSREKIFVELTKTFKLSRSEQEGVKFIVEHLSDTDIIRADIKDIADHVHYSYIAKDIMPWGRSIPEPVFLNFVLFHRAAQEPFEAYKPRFFSLLAPKVFQAKTIREAALIVNKWCGEQVFFRPTSGWDIGPISLLKRGFGRCEELAVLLVSALRSVSIPARIAWTPAWRHADGNHAWVEVYLDDGKWHFLDATSPQEDFDNPWFKPLLKYASTIWTTSLTGDSCNDPYPYAGVFLCNETERYTSTQQIRVLVQDAQTGFSTKASVRLLLWNSGRLRAVATKTTDDTGSATFKVGHGGYFIEAITQEGKKKGFLCYQADDNETISINVSDDLPESFDCRLNPPEDVNSYSSSSTFPPIDPSRSETAIDSMRKLVSSWRKDINQDIVNRLAEIGPNAFSLLALMDILTHPEIEALKYILTSTDPKGLALATPLEMRQHIAHKLKTRSERIQGGIRYNDEIFWDYVLAPRIYDEPPFWQSPRLAKLLDLNPNATLSQIAKKVLKFSNQIRQIPPKFHSDSLNPEEILTYRISHSHKETLITLGSLFRSVGIAVLYDEVENTILIHDGKKWLRFNPEARSYKEAFLYTLPLGELIIKIGGQESPCPENYPSYGVDFSLTKLDGDKRIFVKKPQIHRDDRTCSLRIAVPPGYYELTTGRRFNSAETDVFIKWLKIGSGEQLRTDLPAN